MSYFFPVPRWREESDYTHADWEPKFVTDKTESLSAVCQSPPNTELPGCAQQSHTGVQLQFWSAWSGEVKGVRASVSLPHASVPLMQALGPFSISTYCWGIDPLESILRLLATQEEQDSSTLTSPEFLGVLGKSITPRMLLDSDESKMQPMLFASGSLYIHTVCIWAPRLAQGKCVLPSPAVHTAAGGWLSGTACLTRPLPSAESSSLSVSLFSSVQFSDGLMSRSGESQGMLYSLGWKPCVKETVNGCPGGWSVTVERTVGSDLSSEDKCNGGWQEKSISLASTLPLPLLGGHQTTHEALLGLLRPLGYAY